MLPYDWTRDILLHLEDVITESFAFIHWENELWAFGYHKDGNYCINPSPFFCKPVAWLIGKEFSMLKGPLDWYLMRMTEVGLIQHWYSVTADDSLRQKSRIANESVKVEDEEVGSPQPLSLVHLESPFLFLIFGSLLSSLVFVFELVFPDREKVGRPARLPSAASSGVQLSAKTRV